MDAKSGVIIHESNGPQESGVYEVAGTRYVFCKYKGQFCFMIDRLHPDIHEAWRLGYKENIARAKELQLREQ